MSRRWLVVALAVLGGTFFVIVFPDHPAGIPMAAGSSLLIAAPSWLALRRWRGTRSAALLAGVLAAFAYAVEAVGAVTGLPYGTFAYGPRLGPLVFGVVPLILPLSYVPLVLGAVAVGGRVVPGGAGAALTWRRVIVGTLVLLACDLVLDPGAVQLGYWSYAADGRYYGVPASNFVGWVLTGAVAVGIGWWWIGRDAAVGATSPPPGGLVTSVFLMTVFWFGIAVWSGLAVPALLGAVLSGGLWAVGRPHRADPHRADPSHPCPEGAEA